MLRLALIAGTYQPERCGVAHYTACLRAALAGLGVESQVLTTYAASQSIGGPTVLGVVRDWRLPELWTLVKAV